MATRIDELQRPVANDKDRHPSTIARKAVGTARYARQAILLGLRPYFAHRILGELESPRDLDDWVRFVFRFRVTVGPPILELTFDLLPNQVPSEIRRLVKLVAREPPRTVLEVGSQNGGTLFLFTRAAASEALIIGMDLPPTPSGSGMYGWRAALFEQTFGIERQRIRIVREDSHRDSTVERIRKLLHGRPLDFLFIDGEHSYRGVSRDFELYGPLVRSGGVVALHDIMPDEFQRHGVLTPKQTGGVPRFWRELTTRFESEGELLEIVEDPAQDGYGIGVIRV